MLTFALQGTPGLGATLNPLVTSAYDCDLSQCKERPGHHELSALRTRLNAFSRVAGYCAATASGNVNDWDVQALAKVWTWAAALGGLPAMTATSWRAKRLAAPSDVAANAVALLGALGTLPTPSGSIAAACGASTSSSPSSGGSTVATSALGVNYKCSTSSCRSERSPTWQQVFEGIQTLLNTLGGSAGFAQLKVDGLIGNGTVAAWNKAAAWLGARGAAIPTFGSFAQLAASAPQALTALRAATTAPAVAQAARPAAPPVSGGTFVLPPSDGTPADQAALAASTGTPKVYYAIGALAAGAILYAAYRWSAGPVGPARAAPAPTAMQVAGSRRR